MPSQRPYFLSSFLAAFRQQGPSLQSSTATSQQPTKHTSQATAASTPTSSSSSHQQNYQQSYQQNYSTTSSTVAAAAAATASSSPSRTQQSSVAIHSPRSGSIPIPSAAAAAQRRRGSDSSSEGFRDVLGADKWYIGGRTAGGEERFFKLGVVRRVRSNDGLSLDRLSL